MNEALVHAPDFEEFVIDFLSANSRRAIVWTEQLLVAKLQIVRSKMLNFILSVIWYKFYGKFKYRKNICLVQTMIACPLVYYH